MRGRSVERDVSPVARSTDMTTGYDKLHRARKTGWRELGLEKGVQQFLTYSKSDDVPSGGPFWRQEHQLVGRS